MKQFWQSNRLKIIISGVTVAAGVVHLLRPDLAIDAITLGLLAIAILPWLSPLVKSLELPGGLKIELQEMKDIAEKAERAGLLQHSAAPLRIEHTFLQVAKSDPNLALAGFRIEIERRLVALCEQNGITTKSRGLGYLLRSLDEKSVLTSEQRSALADLTNLLNSATHGASVDPPTAQWALDIAPELLESLSRLISPTGPRTFVGDEPPKFAPDGDFWINSDS